MQIVREGAAGVPEGTATALTIGAYDGIHRGHQLILSRLSDMASDRGLATAVVTFDVHPATVLRPESAPLLLTTTEQRLELFEAAGVDYLYLVAFTPERAQTDDVDFAEQVFVNSLRAKLIVVGSDFHFGAQRSGNVDTLTDLGEEHGFDVIGLDLLADPGATEHISSTAIRRALAGGNVEAAAEMLGRHYEIRGEVIGGDQRGRTIGFPTANIPVDRRTSWPADGVYAGWAEIDDGSRYACAINIGKRPTFHQHAEHSLLEAHLLDFSGDLYGHNVRVEFVSFLRSEQRFDGIDALSAQLKTDIENTRTTLGL